MQDATRRQLVTHSTGIGGRLTLPMLRDLVARTADWPDECVVEQRGTVDPLFLHVYKPGCEPTTPVTRGRCRNRKCGREIGLVIHKRHGVGNPLDQWVTCTVRDLIALISGNRPKED